MAATFKYISVGGMKLNPSQEQLLDKMETADYTFDFRTISRLRAYTQYRVIVSDRKSMADTLLKEIAAIESYKKNLQNNNGNDPSIEILGDLKRDLEKLRDKLENPHDEAGDEPKTRNVQDGVPLLGLYRSYDFSYNAPAIYLFKENIDDYASDQNILPDNVFAFVYVHEAMHAFFDSKNSFGYRSVKELEEAFAQCGMIDFMSNLWGDPHYNNLIMDSHDSVSRMQYDGPYEYGFGLSLQEQSSQEVKTAELMERYREISNWIGSPYNNYNNDSAVSAYKKTVVSLQRHDEDDHYMRMASGCYGLVKDILYEKNVKYAEPGFASNVFPELEPSMRDAGIIAKPGAARKPATSSGSYAIPIASDTCIYSGTKTHSHVKEVPLFSTSSLDDMAYALLSVMYHTGSFYFNPGNAVTDLDVSTSEAENGMFYMQTPIDIQGQRYYYPAGWIIDENNMGLNTKDNICSLLDTINYTGYRDFCSVLSIKEAMETRYIFYGPDNLKIYFSKVKIPEKSQDPAVYSFNGSRRLYGKQDLIHVVMKDLIEDIFNPSKLSLVEKCSESKPWVGDIIDMVNSIYSDFCEGILIRDKRGDIVFKGSFGAQIYRLRKMDMTELAFQKFLEISESLGYKIFKADI